MTNDELVSALDESIEDEETGIEEYQNLLEEIKGFGNQKLIEILEEIIEDEQDHVEDLKEMIEIINAER